MENEILRKTPINFSLCATASSVWTKVTLIVGGIVEGDYFISRIDISFRLRGISWCQSMKKDFDV